MLWTSLDAEIRDIHVEGSKTLRWRSWTCFNTCSPRTFGANNRQAAVEADNCAQEPPIVNFKTIRMMDSGVNGRSIAPLVFYRILARACVRMGKVMSRIAAG
jgi:hypothetical protein